MTDRLHVDCNGRLGLAVLFLTMFSWRCAHPRRRLLKWTFFVFHFRRRLSLDLVLLVSRSQQTQLHIIACFASFESSRQFSLFIIVSVFSIAEKKSVDSCEYLNFAAFSDEAN